MLALAMVGVATVAVSMARDSVSCEFDSGTWKRVTSKGHRHDGGAEDHRRRLAGRLMRCQSLTGASVQDVRRELGPPSYRPGGYILGPDWLGIDNDVLYVSFDRSGRVDSVGIAGD